MEKHGRNAQEIGAIVFIKNSLSLAGNIAR